MSNPDLQPRPLDLEVKATTQRPQENKPLDDAGFEYFKDRKVMATKFGGDYENQRLIKGREDAIMRMAKGLPPQEHDRRLVTGAMTEAMFMLNEQEINPELSGITETEVNHVDQMFRQLGRELFGELRTSVDSLTTTLKGIQRKLDNVKNNLLAAVVNGLRRDFDLVREIGDPSKLAKEGSESLKKKMELARHGAIESLHDVVATTEEAVRDGEMSLEDADEGAEDVELMLDILYDLQGVIAGLGKKIKENAANKKNKEAIDRAREKAVGVASGIEHGQGVAAKRTGGYRGRETASPTPRETEIPEDDKKTVPEFFPKDLQERINGADIRSISDVEALVTPEFKRALFQDILRNIDLKINAAVKLNQGKIINNKLQLLGARTMGQLIGIGAENKIYLFPVIAQRRKNVPSADVRAMSVVKYLKEVFNYELAADTRRADELRKRTDMFDEG